MSTKDPRRLLDYGDRLDGLVRGALDAGRADDAGDAARLARIGRRIAEATAAVPPPPASPAPPPAAAAPKAAALSTKGPIVGIAAATLAGFVAIALVASRSPSAPPPAAPAPVVEPAAPAPLQPAAAANVGPTEAVPTVSPADLPSAPVAATKAPAAAKNAAAPSEADEIALLGRAHDALRASPAESLALCKEHETKYAGGHFAQEREAVAIEALVYLRRTDEARRRFAEFERRWPTSSHRVHLESLLPR
jgi:hypothetical protein